MAVMRGKRKRKHTEPCRNRFMKLFGSTPQGREKIEVAQERMENSRNLVQDGKNDEVELEDRALDAMFDAQRGRLPAEADVNAAKAHEEEGAAKARAAAEAVLRLVRVSAEEELHRKRKLEEETKQQEEDAKRQK